MKNRQIEQCVETIIMDVVEDLQFREHYRAKWYKLIEDLVIEQREEESSYARSQYECGC